MDIKDIFKRTQEPIPWAEGEKIPWNESNFSERMLREHLNQAHHLASRKQQKIDAHVHWIAQSFLKRRPAKILDLGCGPGLYLERFAKELHHCVGIDFSPASIRYARESAAKAGLNISYMESDIRQAEYGKNHDLICSIYGEFNVFRSEEAQKILSKTYGSLSSGGVALFEVHSYEMVKSIGQKQATWSTPSQGVFSDQPHLYLVENFWNEQMKVATTRYFIVDLKSKKTAIYASSMQAYTNEDYTLLFKEAGFKMVKMFPSLIGEVDVDQSGFVCFVGFK